MTGIVCLAPVTEFKTPRPATYEATLAERREERWAGAYRSSSENNKLYLNIRHSDNSEVLKNKTAVAGVTLVFRNEPAKEQNTSVCWCLCFL